MKSIRRLVIGQYNRSGYEVLTHCFCPRHNGEAIDEYVAGNSPYDSGSSVSSHHALPIRKIRRCCIQTAREIAREKGAQYGGVERVEEDL